ncbi:ComEC/Rec2 family competence protein [Lacinutrix iliipiscaria]|uniref:ComEC/Rec2 family competence protein n=1 Tax=Lacinutrix iliipiscaria TaxID=1230532 RepID=A0ABW5WNU4_9FLAO
MKLINFTIIKLCACLIVGILIAQTFSISTALISLIAIILLTILSLLLYVAKKQFNKTIWFGVTTYITTIFIGITSTNFHNQKHFSNHYTHNYSFKNDSVTPITFRIKKVLKSGFYHDKYIIEILQIASEKTSGKALLNIPKDHLTKPLNVDAIYNTSERFTDINSALNPNQFDYKAYLEKQYIYHQLFVSPKTLFHVSDNIHTLNGYANKLRNTINQKLQLYHFKSDELAIINALILGQRQNIDKAVYTNYINAGAVHILAVSGLHIGILLLILNGFFKPLERLKHGKTIKMVLIILLLWSYALIAGASASVIRASTMFSIVAIGMHLKRPSNIYNTLAISVFFILLFKPLFLFDVGFQLSYLAVLAIVSIQPILYNIWKPKFWLPDKLWQILTVTLAAQFGVLPISFFYFHQFPGLFWLSNIIIIPLLGLILTTGIIIIIMASLNILPQLLADCFGEVISLMNTFFGWIAKQDQFIIKDISFSLLHVFTSYFIIITLISLYINRSHKSIIAFCISIISLQAASVYTKYKNSNDAFIIFYKSRHTVIAQKHHKRLDIFHNLDTIKYNEVVSDYLVANYIHHVTEDTLQDLFVYKNKTIFLVDSLGVYNIKTINPDYVLLYNSPKINLERLMDSLQPKGIIADGSNYKSYITRWESSCKKRKLPFYQTGKTGAFILSD